MRDDYSITLRDVLLLVDAADVGHLELSLAELFRQLVAQAAGAARGRAQPHRGRVQQVCAQQDERRRR